MSAQHTLTSSHGHARPRRFGRLLSLVKGHGALPEFVGRTFTDTQGGTWNVVPKAQPDAHESARQRARESEEWWGMTTMDYPPALDRAYVPSPAPVPVPDIYDDLQDLPVLRDTIRATTQRGGTECGTCGRVLPGGTWAERFAAQLAHLGSGEDAPSSGAWYPAEPAEPAEAEPAEPETAEAERAA